LLAAGCSSSSKRIDPEKAREFYTEGKAEQEQGRHTNAVESFSNALQHNATFADAYFARASSYLEMRRMEKSPYPTRELVDRALTDYGSAVSTNPTFADAYFSRAMLLASRARYRDSVADLLVCTRYAPRDPEPHLLLGELYESKFENEIVAAMKHYEQYVALGGTNEGVREKVAVWKRINTPVDMPRKEPTEEEEKKARELHEQFQRLYPAKEEEAFRAVEELVSKYAHTKYFAKYSTALSVLYKALKEGRERRK